MAAFHLQDVLVPIEGASFLITRDRGSWLDAHAHDKRQTRADAAQCAPSVVCLAIKQPMSRTNEEVVVVGASHPATIEAFAYLEGLYCGQRHHCLRKLGLQLVKARLPNAYRYSRDGASAHTTCGVLLGSQPLDAGGHPGCCRGVRTAGVELLACSEVKTFRGLLGLQGRAVASGVLAASAVYEVPVRFILRQCANRVDVLPRRWVHLQRLCNLNGQIDVHDGTHPAHDLSAVLLEEPLLSKGACSDASDGLPCRGAAPAARGTRAVLHLVGVVRVPWPWSHVRGGIVELPLILVADHHRDRCP